MSLTKHIGLLMWLLCTIGVVKAQPQNHLEIKDGRLVVYVNLHSSATAINDIFKTAGIEHADLSHIKNGNYTSLQQQGWAVSIHGKDELNLTRSLTDVANEVQSKVMNPVQLSGGGRPGYPAPVTCGVNNFARITVHELENGLTRFFLPGNLDVRRVVLSGNFNNWATLKSPMNKTDSGWVIDVRLAPGIYAYKFIINGHWNYDTNNNLHEPDGFGSYNSIYYRYNYAFGLPGYASARRVVLSGSFNNWNAGQFIMNHSGGKWLFRLYLHEGLHLYRFMVDGQPVTDPANPVIHTDNSGQRSSVLNIGETVVFTLNGYSNAQQVSLAGDFTQWQSHPLPMKKVGSTWVLPYTFKAGNYQYKFVADGQWITDPGNPYQAETDGIMNSFLAVKPSYTFRLKGYGNASQVRLSGDFNNWSNRGYSMSRQGDEWVFSLHLEPGKHLYKFIVDGNWIIDPGNKQWEHNDEGTGNSVIWIN